MTIRIFAFACGMLMLDSCTNPASNTAATASGDNPLDSFLAGFKERSLPLSLSICGQIDGADVPIRSFDSSLDARFDIATHVHYGRIATNGDYTAIITLIPADCALPRITTIDKKGALIDSKLLYLEGGGGADAGYRYYSQVRINKDFSLSSVDTMIFFDYDSMTGNPLQGGKSQRIVRSKTGKFCTDGKIQLSEMKCDTTITIIDTSTYTYR
jgi:hypothetical protein